MKGSRKIILQNLLMLLVGFQFGRVPSWEWETLFRGPESNMNVFQSSPPVPVPVYLQSTSVSALSISEVETKNLAGDHRTIAVGSVVISKQAYSYRYPTDRFVALGNSNMIVTVMSPAKKKHRRDMIRATWANRADNVFFVVSGVWTESLESEFATHGDLIWVNVEEDYLKLTVKVYAAFHAVHHHIAPLKDDRFPRYILKADDDVYVKLPELKESLYRTDNRAVIIGSRFPGSQVVRKTKSPWFLSQDTFANATFPPYCNGPTYAVLDSFLDCALDTIAIQPHYIGIEDAQGGILARICGDRKVEHRAKWLDVKKWDNQSLATHFSYFVKGEATLASAMFRTHKMNSKTSCTTCFEDALRTIGKTVDCGNNRRAASCELCPEGQGAAQCGGDCQFCDFGIKNGLFIVHDSQCRPNNEQCPKVLPVNCGGHLAESCSECPQGHGKKWCNHDCHWCGNGCSLKTEKCEA